LADSTSFNALLTTYLASVVGGPTFGQAVSQGNADAQLLANEVAGGLGGTALVQDDVALMSELNTGVLGMITGDQSAQGEAAIANASDMLGQAIDSQTATDTSLTDDVAALVAQVTSPATGLPLGTGDFLQLDQTTIQGDITTLIDDQIADPGPTQQIIDETKLFTDVQAGSVGTVSGGTAETAYENDVAPALNQANTDIGEGRGNEAAQEISLSALHTMVELGPTVNPAFKESAAQTNLAILNLTDVVLAAQKLSTDAANHAPLSQLFRDNLDGAAAAIVFVIGLYPEGKIAKPIVKAAEVLKVLFHGLASGDVHLTTYDGLHYNFQAAGEFVLTKSTQPGNTFQVQVRLQPYNGSTSVTVMTQIAAAVGTDRLTFGIGRSSFLMVDGEAPSLGVGKTLDLADGQLVQLAGNEYQLTWNTGEVLTVTNAGSYINLGITGGPADTSGSVEGLLGSDSGQANDFALPDGMVLPQPLSATTFYTQFANAWRISQATSLMDYAAGQTTATFTNSNFPIGVIPLSTLPADVVQNAEKLVAAAGITDPGIAQDATSDYIFSGDSSFIQQAAQEQATAATTGILEVTETGTLSGVGIAPVSSTVTEAASTDTPVVFEIYRTSPTSVSEAVDYTAIAPGTGDVGAAAFLGGVLPSGQVTIAAGATSAEVTLELAGGIGSVPSATLQVQVDTGQSGVPVLASVASVTIGNAHAVAGGAAVPEFLDPSGIGQLTLSGSAAALDLGRIDQAGSVPSFNLLLANQGASDADPLSGTFTITSGTGIDFGTLQPIVDLTAGDAVALPVNVETMQTGHLSETLSFTGEQSNASGYVAPLTAVSLTVEADIIPCFMSGTQITTVERERPVEELAIGDHVTTAFGQHARVKWIGYRQINLSGHKRPDDVRPVRIRAGAFGERLPARDLRLSPDHAVFCNGLLVPIRHLLNGASVVQEPATNVTYWHIELDQHDVILAEGLPCESYLDTGNRAAFENNRFVETGATQIALSDRVTRS
jgi:hypothetical protein